MRIGKVSLLGLGILMLPVMNAQASDWQQEVSLLREDVQVLQRRVKALDSGVSAETNTLQVKSGKSGDAIRRLNIKVEDLQHQLEESAAKFDRIQRDAEMRIKMIEGKDIPAELSAPVPAMPTTFAAPVAEDAARAVVGDEIQGEDLAPLEDYNNRQFEY